MNGSMGVNLESESTYTQHENVRDHQLYIRGHGLLSTSEAASRMVDRLQLPTPEHNSCTQVMAIINKKRMILPVHNQVCPPIYI